MGRRFIVTIDEAERGNVLRVQFGDPNKKVTEEVEIIEGQQGSVNLKDRTRRRVAEIVAAWYPAARGETASTP